MRARVSSDRRLPPLLFLGIVNGRGGETEEFTGERLLADLGRSVVRYQLKTSG